MNGSSTASVGRLRDEQPRGVGPPVEEPHGASLAEVDGVRLLVELEELERACARRASSSETRWPSVSSSSRGVGATAGSSSTSSMRAPPICRKRRSAERASGIASVARSAASARTASARTRRRRGGARAASRARQHAHRRDRAAPGRRARARARRARARARSRSHLRAKTLERTRRPRLHRSAADAEHLGRLLLTSSRK